MEKRSDLRYAAVMAMLTLLTVFKIHLGLFHDETFTVHLGKLVLDGMNTAQVGLSGYGHYLLAPLMALYHRIAGSNDGVILFIRYLYVLIHLAVALYVESTLSLFWSKRQARAASVVSFLFSFGFYTVNYKSLLCWGALLTVLFLLRYHYGKRRTYLVVSAITLSATVLAYPTALLMVIPVTVFLYRYGSDRKKELALYWGTCITCAALFLGCLFLFNPLEDILYGLSNVVEVDIDAGGRSALPILRRLVVLTAEFVFAEGLLFIWRRLRKGESADICSALTVFLWALLAALILAKYQTTQASRFWYVLSLFFFLFCSIFRKKEVQTEHPELIRALFLDYSAWLMVAIALATNQGLAIIAAGSFVGIIGAVVALLDQNNAENARNGTKRLAISITMILIICSAVFVSDENMMVESSNIFQRREVLTAGPGKGIYVTAYTEERYSPVVSIARSHVNADDRFLLISNDCRFSGVLSAEGKATCYLGMQPDLYGEALVKYCRHYPDWKPTVVIVDTDRFDDFDTWIHESPFGIYLQSNYDVDNARRQEGWVIIR